MGVVSINNGTLQLNELLISNEKYSNSAGYVPSTSSFTAGLTGTNLAVGSLTLLGGNQPYPTITATSGTVNNVSIGGDINIGDNLVINPNFVVNPGVPAILYNGVTSPAYGGGMYAYQALETRPVPANGTSTYTTSVPFNPFPGWADYSTSNCIPIVTPLCDYALGIQSVTITQTVGQPGYITIAVLLYNAWQGTQNAYGVNVLLFYQP
jgi:hypothetical protein